MMDRREFVVAAAFAGGAALLSRPAFARAKGARPLGLFDRRFAGTADFIDLCGGFADSAIELEVDVVVQWLTSLRTQVAGEARELFGLTTHSDLLLLQDLARAHGRKLRFHAMHPASNAAGPDYRVMLARRAVDRAWGESVRRYLRSNPRKAAVSSWVIAE